MLRLISLYLVGILKDYPDKFTEYKILIYCLLSLSLLVLPFTIFHFLYLNNQICKSIVYTIYGLKSSTSYIYTLNYFIPNL